MKKIVSLMLAFVMSLVVCAPTFAIEGEERLANAEFYDVATQEIPNQSAEEKIREHYKELGYTEVKNRYKVAEHSSWGVSPECVELAYLELNSASPELQEKILAARQQIIYKANWRANEDVYITWFDGKEKIWAELPTFDELFPDWEIPVIQDVTDSVETAEDLPLSAKSSVLNG